MRTAITEMKSTLNRTIQRVVIKRHDQHRRLLSAGSRSHLSTLPLAETGWELPMDDYQHAPPAEYNCSVEGNLANLLEIYQLGKCEMSFNNVQQAVQSARQHTCYLCGRNKFLNELCGFCSVVGSEQR